VNRLFIEIYFATAQSHFGIIIAVRHPPHEIFRRLLLVLMVLSA
jgi:hypothetical protein